MNQNNIKPWPHSPAVIAKVEEYDDHGNLLRSYHETRLGSEVLHSSGHAGAVHNAEEMKYWQARDRVQADASAHRPTLSIADELSA